MSIQPNELTRCEQFARSTMNLDCLNVLVLDAILYFVVSETERSIVALIF